jgi:PHD/YefM family antitoxin component YafN of YafNO toxin-antitoxin module
MAEDFVTPEPITVTQLRGDVRYYLDQTDYFDRRFLLLRNGKATAVLLSLNDFRRLLGAPGAAEKDVQR